MLTPLPTTFDNSILDTFLSCPTKYYYNYVRNLRLRGDGVAPAWGSFVHDVLEAFYGEELRSQADPALRMGMAFEANRSTWPREGLEDSHCQPPYTADNALRILLNYAHHYGNDPILEVVHTEVNAAAFLTDTIQYIGRVDLVAKVMGLLCVVDHKTTKWAGPAFLQSVYPNRQMTGYVWLAQQNGLDCDAAMLNVIKVGIQEPRSAPSFMRSAPTSRTKWDLDTWLRDTLWAVEAIYKAHESNHWFRNESQCSRYGECSYRTLCMMRSTPDEVQAPGTYEVYKWEPWVGARGGQGNASN